MFKDGKPNGNGLMIFPDGRKYKGMFENNKFKGKGTMTFPDGTEYVGMFKNNKFTLFPVKC